MTHNVTDMVTWWFRVMVLGRTGSSARQSRAIVCMGGRCNVGFLPRGYKMSENPDARLTKGRGADVNKSTWARPCRVLWENLVADGVSGKYRHLLVDLFEEGSREL